MPIRKDMLGRSISVSVQEALKLLNNLPLKKTEPETTLIEQAYGRVLCGDIASPENMPGFSRSTMDGYAVKASDTFGCSESIPAYLKLRGEVRMGETPDVSIKSGEAALILTGGMLPEGADAVVMLENVQTNDDMIEVLKPVAPQENVITAGEDVKKGDVVHTDGHRLRPQDIAALAGLGIIEIPVYKKPTVGIISTGDEIVPPQSKLTSGQVRDMNSYNLAGLILDSGGEPIKYGILPDEYSAIYEVVDRALELNEMVLISGGSSVGARDMTEKVIEAIEPKGVLFHGVAIKPGKPLIAAFLRGKPVFGLPGHPAAVSVSYLQFIRDILLRIGGCKTLENKEKYRIIQAIISKNVSSAPGREDHIRVSLSTKNGELYAEPILGKSGLIRTLVRADGIIVIASHSQGLPKGETVYVRVFD